MADVKRLVLLLVIVLVLLAWFNCPISPEITTRYAGSPSPGIGLRHFTWRIYHSCHWALEENSAD